jgi:hypothetical protein
MLSNHHRKLRRYRCFYAAGTTVGVTTNIEQVLLRDDDVDEKRDWQKEVPMDEVPESIRDKHWQCCLSMNLCWTADSAKFILPVTL